MSALKNIRERKGFNISQLASRSGISGKILLEYEEGRQVIPLAHAKLLAKALWVEVDELMPPPGSVTPTPVAAQTQPAPAPRLTQPQPQPARPVSPVQISVTQAAAPAAAPTYSPAPPAAPQQEARIQRVQHNGQGAKPEGRGQRAPKTVPPVTEGQIQELLQLAHRLDISQEQLEERVGKPIAALMRPEATDWVKRLRAIADEIAPASKIRYGRWPDAAEDKEAAYLAKQREEGTICLFHLFNGEEFSGTLLDFTPYTITIKSASSDEEVVLRKLAIAYYRSTPTGNPEASGSSGQSSESMEAATPAHDHKRDDKDLDSDRVGQPEKPEKDKMDEDRGV